MAAVLKTAVPGRVPGVRIPLPPPDFVNFRVAIYRLLPGFDSGGLTHGFMPFAHASDFADALRDIGYAKRGCLARRDAERARLSEFVYRLVFRGPPEARAEFVRRVLALR